MNRQNILVFRGTRAASLAIKRRMLIFLHNLLSCSPNFRPIEIIREAFLRIGGVVFGSKLSVGDNFFYLNGRNLRFGKDCTLGHFCHFYDWCPIKIGDRLFCSNQLTVVSASHDPITYESTAGPVTIGNNVWIGINVTVVGPVTIGDNVVIGAGSVVLKDIPSNAIAAGVPAKVIRMKPQTAISHD
jgi:acetyltransferase-like isoleucine patch superfamily enzyme